LFLLRAQEGLRNAISKRDSSTSQASNFPGGKLEEKRRLVPVGNDSGLLVFEEILKKFGREILNAYA